MILPALVSFLARGRNCANLAKLGSNLAAKFGQCSPMLVEIGPNLADFG